MPAKKFAIPLLIVLILAWPLASPAPVAAGSLYRVKMGKRPAAATKLKKPPKISPELKRELEALETQHQDRMEKARQELMLQLNQAQQQYNQDLAGGMDHDSAFDKLVRHRIQLQRAYLAKRKALALEYQAKAADARAKLR